MQKSNSVFTNHSTQTRYPFWPIHAISRNLLSLNIFFFFFFLIQTQLSLHSVRVWPDANPPPSKEGKSSSPGTRARPRQGADPWAGSLSGVGTDERAVAGWPSRAQEERVRGQASAGSSAASRRGDRDRGQKACPQSHGTPANWAGAETTIQAG